MASGKICTGFSKPYVALYGVNAGEVSYTNGRILARGVSVSLTAETSDDNTFYADNAPAETAGGMFTGGSITLEVDGLLEDAEAMIMGLGTPSTLTIDGETVDIYEYGADAVAPYVGIGFIARYMSDGITSYTPVVLQKCIFEQPSTDATTQSEGIEWQTQSLTASIMRDDSSDRIWKKIGDGQATEADAEAVVKALLNIA